jgi:hypothetical protein
LVGELVETSLRGAGDFRPPVLVQESGSSKAICYFGFDVRRNLEMNLKISFAEKFTVE